MRPGEIQSLDGDVTLSPGRPRVELTVTNQSDYPILVGSHYHFFEVNPRLAFDRDFAFGMHLDIPAGNCAQFPPHQPCKVRLVAYSGRGELFGFWGVTQGPATAATLSAARQRAGAAGLIREEEGP